MNAGDFSFCFDQIHNVPHILSEAFARYQLILFNTSNNSCGKASTGPHLSSLDVTVDELDESLSMNTNESYTLTITAMPSSPKAVVHAKTVYGALHALETFTQLAQQGAMASSYDLPAVDIHDFPQYQWRGFMVDTGRRFWPVSLLHWLIDAMVVQKLNVLHLHLSDFCRFSVESKVFPALTANLTGIHAGFYTQEEVRFL